VRPLVTNVAQYELFKIITSELLLIAINGLNSDKFFEFDACYYNTNLKEI